MKMNMQPTYTIRFFYDYFGSFFWSGDDRTRETFGYLIWPSTLPLSKETVEQANALLDEMNSALNWELPDPPWTQEQSTRFQHAMQTLFETAKAELGEDFALVLL